MTASDRLNAALETLHWSAQSFAHVARINERTARRWAAGAYEPPEDLLHWLETMAAFHRANPPPVRE